MEPPFFLPLLDTAMNGVLPLLMALLAAKTYVDQGSRIFVLLGCGMLAPGLGSILGSWGLAPLGQNYAVVVHNFSLLMGGGFNTGAVAILYGGSAQRVRPAPRRAAVLCAAAFAATAALVLALSWAAVRGFFPGYFLPAQDPTLLRQAVLTAGAMCYTVSAILLVALHARTGMAFLGLYANALFLAAIGLAAFLATRTTGTLLGWTGRASQYAANVYFVLALILGQRETGVHGTSLPRYLTELFRSRLDEEVRSRTQELLDLNRRLEEEAADREKAEEDLRRSEERLRLAAEATGFGVYSIEHQRGFAYYSPELLALFGLCPADPLPMGADRVPLAVHQDDRAEVASRVRGSHDPRGPGLVEVEYRVYRPDGEMRWLRLRGRTAFGGVPAAPVLSTGIVQDVTARRLAQEQLLESEKVYRSIIANSLQGFAILQGRRIVLCNDALCRLTGYTAEESRALSEQEVEALLKPEEPLPDPDVASVPEVKRLQDKAGKTHWVEVLAARTQFAGQPALQLSLLDITEKTRAEEAYRTLVDNATEGFAIAQRGRVVFANAALGRISGWLPSQLLRMDAAEVMEFIHPEDRQSVLAAALSPNGEQYAAATTARFRHRDGSWRFLEARSVGVHYEGTPAFLVSVKDVTAERAAEERLNTTHRKMRNLAVHLLHAREEERRKVAQEVHDEIGQTLAALKMDLHRLESRVGGQSAEVRHTIHGTIDLGEQAIRTVQRISSELRPRMLDDLGLVPALDWLAADFGKRTRIPCTVSAEIPPGLIGGNSATSLYRVVQEALANVARHSRARSASVSLSASRTFLLLRVEDDGVGITPAQSSAPDSYGLIGIHERVEGLGGTVAVEPGPGRGTVLEARIPLPGQGGLP